MKFLPAVLALGIVSGAVAQKPADTEVWEPKPAVITNTTATTSVPPSDAIVLFDGKNLDQWESVNEPGKAAGWTVAKNVFTVKKGTGNIQTKKAFTDYQLHIEWQVPANIHGEGQGRGNSGLFLASTGKGDDGYELQIMDGWENATYVNGQAASVYKQTAPLVNASKKPGEWQSYDVTWTAPVFNTDGTLKSPAYVTVLHNGVMVQNHTELKGKTVYIGKPEYNQHGASPIKLQDHGDPSEPLSFRNIWIREMK
ncbi:MAG: DUF1080 domain-containing protein [Chitinophagaceae bacterium]|nr:MAG: DUF1080 domain-containing protein [Chitinophagaceae bacterium]